jgi:hypothetical protein
MQILEGRNWLKGVCHAMIVKLQTNNVLQVLYTLHGKE